MGRRRKWKCTIIILLMVMLDLVAVAWSYEGSNSRVFFGSRINSEYSQLHRAWRVRGRRIKGQGPGRGQLSGGGGGSQRRNHRLPWETTREEPRIDRFRPNNKRRQGSFHTEPLFPIQSVVQECCPTITEMIEPIAGKNRTGHLVELYRDEHVRQRFYEISCLPDVVDKPCRFLENRHSKFSTCSQKFTYTYALINPPNHDELMREEQPYFLDHVSIRSGCACEVTAAPRRRRKQPQRGN